MDHKVVVEMETDCGYRYWSKSMPESDSGPYIDKMIGMGEFLSDVDHSTDCWCFQ